MLDRALSNLVVGMLRIGIVGISGLLLSKILILQFGNNTYGIIALFTSLNSYLSLFLIAISGVVYKFCSIEYFKGPQSSKAVEYFSTAFYSMLIISLLVLVALIGFTPYLSKFVDIGDVSEIEVKKLFIFSAVSFLIINICSVFFVPTMILSKIYLNDIANIVATLTKFLLVILFSYIFHTLDLEIYGYILLIFSIIYLLLSIIFSKKAMPNFSVNYHLFSFSCAKEMVSMGWKVLLNSIGILLYTNTDVLIINQVLGTAFVSDYSIPMQIAILVALFGGMMSRLYEPIISKLISENKLKVLGCRLISHTKIFTLCIGFLLIVLTCFSKKILNIWLGDEYIRLNYILVLLAMYHFFHQSTVLFSRYFTLTNNLVKPLCVTIFAGVGNIILSLAFLYYTDLGLVGVIIATLMTVIFKTVVFNTSYTSLLIGLDLRKVVTQLGKVYSFIIIITMLLFLYSESQPGYFELSDIWKIFFIGLIYFGTALLLVLNKKERSVMIRMFKLNFVLKWV
ncbi:oligosaccharide flippase family protein [Vibrio cyclitrophicus]